MDISLITPVGKRSRSGNRATAERWAGLLRELGHRVKVARCWPGRQPANAPQVLVAIHAWRSAPSVAAFRQRFAGGGVVVLMAGTDIYRFQHSHPEQTLQCMEHADRLVGLHDQVASDLPPRFASKLRIIHQSAAPLPGLRQPSARSVDICVVGHLREEKDPFRTALAARALPARSRVRVLHLGKAHDPAFAAQARREMSVNPRYHWLGEVPRWKVRKVLARAHAMVISSRTEGGANVVSEAVVAGVPVIASHIPGNVGLLGTSHPGYYPPGDTQALTSLLHRVENDGGFLAGLSASAALRRELFSPARERSAWAALLGEMGP